MLVVFAFCEISPLEHCIVTDDILQVRTSGDKRGSAATAQIFTDNSIVLEALNVTVN